MHQKVDGGLDFSIHILLYIHLRSASFVLVWLVMLCPIETGRIFGAWLTSATQIEARAGVYAKEDKTVPSPILYRVISP